MKINMAAEEYFSVGMIVSCDTCHGKKIQGEVIAFDYTSKMLVLKSPGTKPGMHDVQLVNLSFVSDVVIQKEAPEDPAPQLKGLNLQKLHARVKQNSEEKIRQVNNVGVGVTPTAQKLFYSIIKTINDVKWDGQNIVVMNETFVYPPYGVENCKGKSPNNSTLTNHVKKLVEKYHKDQQRECSPASSSSSS